MEVVAVDVFSVGLRGSPQVAVLSSIVACMLGLSLATGSGAHFRPAFADKIVPHAWVDRAGDAISSTLYAVFTAFAVGFVMQSYAYSDRVPVLNMPLWPVQFVMPYVLASCCFKHAMFAILPKTKEALAAETS